MKRDTDKRNLKEAVVKCWCSKTKRTFGIVVVSESKQDWIVQHSFLCSAHYVDSAAESTAKIGQVHISQAYNGCKHCGNNDLVQCGECKEYSCYSSAGFFPTISVQCGHCGIRGAISGIAKSMKLSGD